MDNNNTESKLGEYGFILFVVGIYIFLFGLIKANAQGFCKLFFGAIITFLFESLGICTILAGCSSKHFAHEVDLYVLFGLVTAIYLAMVIHGFIVSRSSY
jgi:uncharacterized membrane protein YiaA